MVQDGLMSLLYSAWYVVGIQHKCITLVLLGVTPRDMGLTAGHYPGHYVSSAVAAPSSSALGYHFLL